MSRNPEASAPHSERTRPVAAAQELYFQQPTTQVLPADLASRLGLPVSAVHQWFATPELLVQSVVDALVDQLHTELFHQKETSSTAVAELLALTNWAQRQASQAAFFQYLQVTYPVVWRRWQEHLEFFLLLHLRNNLRWGIMQDFYQATLNEELLARCWLQALLSTEPASEAGPHGLLQDLVADVATPAGNLAMQRLLVENAPGEQRTTK